MAFTEFIPGMKPGSTVRNIIVGFIYLIFFYLIPFILAYAVFTNRNGLADKLSSIPGISESGGVVSALAIFLISFVVISVITVALPSEETPSTGEPSNTDGASPESDSDANSDDGGQSEESTESDSDANSDDEGQSEESTESESSADEQQEQVDEAETTDTDGDEADTAENEAENEEISDEEIITLFESLVESEGMTVETAEMQGDIFTVEYTSYSQTERELASEIGYVAGAYAGMVGEGHTSDRMEATILAASGEPAGTFYVEYEWAEAYENGEISDEEFSQRVISTLSSEGQASIQADTSTATTQPA